MTRTITPGSGMSPSRTKGQWRLKWRRRAGQVGLTLAGSLALAACGSSGTDQTGKPNAAGLIPIKVAGTEGSNSSTPLFAAQKLGYFKDAGLDVTYTSMSGGAAAMAAAINAGQIDVGIGSATQWIGDSAHGVIKGKLIGEFTDNNYVIIGSDRISDMRQLKGKMFAISSRNAGDHLYSQSVLARYGIGPDDVVWLQMGEPAARLAALTAGKIDATEIPLTNLPVSQRKRILLSADDSPVPFVSNAIFARQPLIDANKAALTRFLAAMGKAADWVRAHPAEAVPACLESGSSVESCTTAIDVARNSKSPYTWSSTMKINAKGIETMLPIIGSVVPQAKAMKLNDIVDTSVAPSK